MSAPPRMDPTRDWATRTRGRQAPQRASRSGVDRKAIDCCERAKHQRALTSEAIRRTAMPSRQSALDTSNPRTMPSLTSPNPIPDGLIRCKASSGPAVTATPSSDSTAATEVEPFTSATAAPAGRHARPSKRFGSRRCGCRSDPPRPTEQGPTRTSASPNLGSPSHARAVNDVTITVNAAQTPRDFAIATVLLSSARDCLLFMEARR